MSQEPQPDDAVAGGVSVSPLRPQQARAAYAFLCAAGAEISFDAWLDYAVHARGGACGRGIVAAQNERGYIHGLLTYAVEPDLAHGAVFRICDLITPHRADGLVVRALYRVAETLAAAEGCSVIYVDLTTRNVVLPVEQNSADAYFRGLGFSTGGVRLAKRLDR